MSYRYTSSSFKYSSTGEDDSSSSTRRTSFRSGGGNIDDDDGVSSSVSRSTRITRTIVSGSDEPETTSSISTTRRSTRLTSDDGDFGLSRRGFDDDSTSRLSRRLAEEASDDAFSSKRTKVEVEGGVSGYSMRSSKITQIDSSGEVKSYETSSKQMYSSTFGGEGGDVQMLEDSSPVGSIYVAVLDYKPLSTDDDGLALKEGDEVKVLETGKTRKWKVVKMSSGESGWVGSYCLEKAAGAITTTEPATPTQEKKLTGTSLSRKETLVKELVDTEEDFARDMLYVVTNYLREMDNPAMPKRLREFKEQLFYNFTDICDFHNDQLITGIKFNAREPTKLGTTLLRMERDFDKHVKYVEQEHKAQQLLKDEPELREYFEKFSKKIGDEKTIQEHLKLPLQRINDYQLILKELIKCNAKAGEDFTDLQRALDFMQAIPQRSTDLEYINKMEGYSGNIQKFGRILKETTEATVTEEAGNLKLESKTSSEGPIVMKVEDKEEWSKQLQASTVKSEVVEKMTADEELRIKEEDLSARIDVTQDDDANRTTTTGVSDLEPRGTSPTSGDKPKFVQTLRGVSIHQNDTATLECVIESEPAPHLKWLKNNVPVRKGPRVTQLSDAKTGRHSLTITNAQAEDAAMYTIVASNPSGTTSCSAPFNVRTASGRPDSRPTSPGGTELPFAPVFKVKLKDTELLEGTSVRFELVVHGFPTPEVAFYKDGEPLKMDDRIRVHYENKEVFELIIDHVTEGDSAVYSCVAMNSEGCDSTAGCITVTKNKVLFQGLTEDGNAGDKSATPQPVASPAFTWFKDGREFEASERFQVAFNDDEDTLALVFQHVKPEDAGIYTCVASTYSGKISCSAELTVQGTVNYREPAAPTIEASMEDVEVNEGASAMLELKITGWPRPRIAWTKGEKLIESGHGGKYKFLFEDDESMTLVIRSVTKEDAGKYDVLAENELGSASAHCNLHVKCPPKFKKELKDASVMTEKPLKLDVEVEGVPEPDVKWYKDGQQVVTTDRVKLVHQVDSANYALVVDKAKVEDAGSYTCVISNPLGSQSGHAAVTVNSAPKIIKKLESYEATITETVTFTTKVAGVPKPKVEWLKDGKSVLIDGKKYIAAEDETNVFSLTIDCCGPDDVGSYTVVVTNDYGKAEDSAQLTIKIKPKFTKGLEDKELVEGEVDIELSVVVEAKPEPTIQWWHDGALIKDSKLYATKQTTESGQYTLVIKQAVAEAGGKIKCTAENKHGKADTEAKVTVNAKPKITECLKDQSVIMGADATFTIKYAGSPKPEATWVKNGANIKVDGSHYRVSEAEAQFTLVIKDCKDDDKGSYKVVIENKYGKDESSAALKVTAALGVPKFDQPLAAATLCEGDDGQLEGKVAPNTDGSLPEVSWLKDGKPLKADDPVMPFSLPDGSIGLKFSNAAQPDAAKYTAVLTNPGGDTADSSAPVEVTPKTIKKPTFAQGLKPSKFREGEPGRLEAKLNPNDDGSIPDVEWLKDGKPLTEADGVKFIKKPDGTVALEIPKCKLEDAGKYTLRAKNPDGGAAESSAPVEVSSNLPVFETQLKGLNLTEGDELKLVCKVKSDTPITAKWFRDGVEVGPDPLVVMKVEPDGSVVFTIANCIPGDAGKYRCEVTNQSGTSASEADVTIKALKREKPIFIDGLKATAFDEGKPGKLEAKVGGFPKPDIKWLKDGKPITDPRFKVETKPDGSTTLTIDNVKPDDAGEYSIVAKNEQGENKSSAPVTVNKKPSFLKPLEACSVPIGETAKLSSQVAGSPKPKIEWLKDGKPIKADGKRIVANEDDKGNCSLTIKDTTPADAGTYAIKATNPMGEMKSEAPLKVDDGKAPTFLSPLKDQSVPEGGKLVLEAKVMGKPSPEIKWFRKGKPITEADGAKISFDGETARLEIPKVAMADAGQYECKLVSPAGEQSSKANVKILRPPKFIKPLLDTEVALGVPLVLECELLCDDEPEISWTYRGAPIHDGAKYTITKSDTKCKLFIANPTVNDCGEYQCTAKNAAGQDSTTCKGTVKEPAAAADSGEPPSFLKKLTDQELIAGSTAKLIACIAGRPEPDVKWYKDGVEVVLTDRHSFERDRNGIIRLVIRNLTESDFGEYRCEISNPHGKADCTCKLTEDSKPSCFAQRDNDYNNLLTNRDTSSLEDSGMSISSYYRECLASMPQFRAASSRSAGCSSSTADPDSNIGREPHSLNAQESRSKLCRTGDSESISLSAYSALSDAELDRENSASIRSSQQQSSSVKSNSSEGLVQSNDGEVSISDYYRQVLAENSKENSDGLANRGSSVKRRHRKHGSPPNLPSRGSSQKKKERKQHPVAGDELGSAKAGVTNEPSIGDYYRAVLSEPDESGRNISTSLPPRGSSIKKRPRKQRSLEDYDETVELTIAAYSKYASETEDEDRPRLPPRASSTKKRGKKSPSSPKSPASPTFDSRERTMSISEYARYASENEEASTAAQLRRQELPGQAAVRKQRSCEEGGDGSMSIAAYARFASENEDSDVESSRKHTHARRLKEVIVECGNEVISIAAYSRNSSGIQEEDANIVTEQQQTAKPQRPNHVHQQPEPDDQISIAAYSRYASDVEDYEQISFHGEPKAAIAADESTLQNASSIPYVPLQPDSALDEMSIGAYSRYASGTDESDTEYMATRFALPARGSSVRQREPRAPAKKEDNLLNQVVPEEAAQEQLPANVIEQSEGHVKYDEVGLNSNELSISAYARYASGTESEAEFDELDRKRREAARKVLRTSYDYTADDEGGRTDVEAKFKVILDKRSKKTIITELIESSERLELEVQQLRAPRKAPAGKDDGTAAGRSETVSGTESDAELFVPRRVIPKLVIEQSSRMTITFEGEQGGRFIRIEEPATPGDVAREIKITVTDQAKEQNADQAMSIQEVSDHGGSQDLRLPDFIDEVSIAAYSRYASEAESDAELFIPRHSSKKTHRASEPAHNGGSPPSTVTATGGGGCDSERIASTSSPVAQSELSISAYARYASEVESDAEASRPRSRPESDEYKQHRCEQAKSKENKESKLKSSPHSRPCDDDGFMSIAAYAKFASDVGSDVDALPPRVENKPQSVSHTSTHEGSRIVKKGLKIHSHADDGGRMSIAAYARYASDVESDVETAATGTAKSTHTESRLQPKSTEVREVHRHTKKEHHEQQDGKVSIAAYARGYASEAEPDMELQREHVQQQNTSVAGPPGSKPPSRSRRGEHEEISDGRLSIAAYARYASESDAEPAEAPKAEIVVQKRTVMTKTASSSSSSRTAIKDNELSIAEYSRYASESDGEVGQKATAAAQMKREETHEAGGARCHQAQTRSEIRDHRMSIAEYARFASDGESDLEISQGHAPQPPPRRERPAKRSDEIASSELSISAYAKYVSDFSDTEGAVREQPQHQQQRQSPVTRERTMSIAEYSKHCSEPETIVDVQPQGVRSPKQRRKRTVKQVSGEEEMSIAEYARYASESEGETHPGPSDQICRTAVAHPAKYASESEEVVQLEKIGTIESNAPSVRARVRPAGGSMAAMEESRMSIAQYARYASETDDSDAEAISRQRKRMSRHLEELIEERRQDEPGVHPKDSPPQAGSPGRSRNISRSDDKQGRKDSSESENNPVRRKGKKGEGLGESSTVEYEHDSSGFESDVTDSDAGDAAVAGVTASSSKRSNSIEARREQFAHIFDKPYRPPSETRRNYDTDGYASQMDENSVAMAERSVEPPVQIRLRQPSAELDEPATEGAIAHEVRMQYQAETRRESRGRSSTPLGGVRLASAHADSSGQSEWAVSASANVLSRIEEVDLEGGESVDEAAGSTEPLATMYARCLLTIMVTCVVCLCMSKAYSSLTASSNTRDASGFPGGDDDPSDSDFDEVIANLGLGPVYKCARRRCCKDDDADV